MKKIASIVTIVSLPIAAAFAADAPGPDWAFIAPDANTPAAAPAAQPAPATAPQPGVPALVTAGKMDVSPPCNTCHLPNAMGGPDAPSLAGLNADYFMRVIKDVATGLRGGPFVPPEAQAAVAKVTPAEVEEVAKYYAGLSPVRWVRVVESTTVPSTTVSADRHRTKLPGNRTEALGKRIIEFADDPALLRQSAQPAFVAYVPSGSLAAGKAIVEGSKTEECASCHGDGLKGSEDIPRLAGRSPTYIARQLYGFKNGVRKGPLAEIMKNVADSLNDDDIIAAASYAASLNPM